MNDKTIEQAARVIYSYTRDRYDRQPPIMDDDIDYTEAHCTPDDKLYPEFPRHIVNCLKRHLVGAHSFQFTIVSTLITSVLYEGMLDRSKVHMANLNS